MSGQWRCLITSLFLYCWYFISQKTFDPDDAVWRTLNHLVVSD
jgi:hypothetical protein